jgi:hypothetical protein
MSKIIHTSDDGAGPPIEVQVSFGSFRGPGRLTLRLHGEGQLAGLGDSGLGEKEAEEKLQALIDQLLPSQAGLLVEIIRADFQLAHSRRRAAPRPKEIPHNVVLAPGQTR